MTVAAKTLLVAESTHSVILVSGHAVVVGEQGRVVVTFKIDRFFLEPMAFCAEFPPLSKLIDFRMSGRHEIAVPCRTGDQKCQYKE